MTFPTLSARRFFLVPKPLPLLAALLGTALAIGALRAADAPFPLSEQPSADDFPLVETGGKAAAICVPANEDPAVRRAAADLAADVERVSGVRPAIIDDPAAATGSTVVIHTFGKGKMESETWLAQTSSGDESTHGHRTLTISGGDRRGTIYGIYTLSEAIGVSPWYWWADVPPVKHASISIRSGKYEQKPPAVKYRGIFLNDEDWGLRPWAAKTFEPEKGNIGPKTYAKIFELLLRLKANTLWPAMHPGTTPFNDFPDDAPEADAYGIIMGSSHCEQMLRDNVGEWKEASYGDYNYATNKAGVLRYWEERVKGNAKYESLFTVGMRGIHDGGMPGGGTPDEKAARLHEIVNDQRGLLSHYIDKEPAQVAQIFCPYKEVLALYRLAPDYPADITLVWPDDNYGYVRQFSSAQEQKRSGGAGVYYHISYWGAPHDYLWLNTTPPALIWEEMSKAFDYGARRVWILNVGDIKPGELGTEYFLRLAWDPHAVGPDNADSLLAASIERDFGREHAPEIMAILRDYYQFNWNRKPEFLESAPGKGLYSTMLHGHDEIAERLEAGRRLVERADSLEKKLPAEQRAAYYQLVLYPVRCAVAMNEKWLNLTRVNVYSAQGRVGYEKALDKARTAFETIQRETAYYNDTLSGGKWRGMMSDHPRDLAVFKLPNTVTRFTYPSQPALGIALEESDPVLMSGGSGHGRLQEFSRAVGKQAFPIDVFNRGGGKLRWTAQADAPWIILSETSGEGDARVMVSVDWTKAPESGGASAHGASAVRFRKVGAVSEEDVAVDVNAVGGGTGDPAGNGPTEDNGRVVIPLHADPSADADAAWKSVRGLGVSGGALAVFPMTFVGPAKPEEIQAGSPGLDSKFSVRTPGAWKVELRTLPTWPAAAGHPQRYAVAVDDKPPTVVSLPLYGEESNRQWQEDVVRNAALTSSVHRIDQPGAHVLHVWAVDPGVVVDGLTLSLTKE